MRGQERVKPPGKRFPRPDAPSPGPRAIPRWRTGKFPFPRRGKRTRVLLPCRLASVWKRMSRETRGRRSDVEEQKPERRRVFPGRRERQSFSTRFLRLFPLRSRSNRDYSPMRESRDRFPVHKSSIWIFTKIDDRLNYAAVECTRTIPLIMI